MGFKRPSRSVTLATVAASCVLAAAGFLVGKRSDGDVVPASVPLTSAKPSTSADPIIVPSTVDFPRR